MGSHISIDCGNSNFQLEREAGVKKVESPALNFASNPKPKLKLERTRKNVAPNEVQDVAEKDRTVDILAIKPIMAKPVLLPGFTVNNFEFKRNSFGRKSSRKMRASKFLDDFERSAMWNK